MKQDYSFFIMYNNLDGKAEYVLAPSVQAFTALSETQTRLKLIGGIEIICNTTAYVIEARLKAFYNQHMPK